MSRNEFRYSVYRRVGSPYWWLRRTIPGIGELRLSTRTINKGLAQKYDYLVVEYRQLGRFDALKALAAGSISLQQLDAHRDPQRLNELLSDMASPPMCPLVTEWFEVGASDTGVRDSSMRRYATSWKRIWEVLPRDARLVDLNQSFVTDFKRHRHAQAKEMGHTLSGATLNRDLAAIGAFLSWCVREKELTVTRPKLKYQPESRGRTRWLSAGEVAAFREACPESWWPLFGLLLGTGMSISEALGLVSSDIDIAQCKVSIHEEHGRKLKRASRARDLSIPHALISTLAAHIALMAPNAMDRVFPFTYSPARKVWTRTCRAAKVNGATIHDCRHTFAVHAVMKGVPEARLQRLLGHSHPGTTRRYASFAPGQFVREDSEAVSDSIRL